MDRVPKSRRRSFHPKDPAFGTRNYDIGALDEYQKRNLNERKLLHRDENEIYLKQHPEIRAFISILLKHVLYERPPLHVHETIGEFFNRPRRQILADLLDYFLQVERKLRVTMNDA
ncbi:uncharacterized protein LOC143185677 [Calliopsis andreniformis]|uniref:uncharacterized protein LOC143185677 n=1 Tax=Calliopsis andreniformis TaxID=337506 RepID=UPI003FCE987C